MAGVGDRQQHILSGLDLRLMARIGLVKHGVGDLDGQPAAVRHGVAGIERQVEHGAFHLGRVGQGVPQAAGDDGLDLDALAERAAQHLGHVLHLPAQIHHPGLQWLAAREGEQLAGQRRGPIGAMQGVLQPLRGLAVLHLGGDQFEIAADHLQDVVEVVGDAAGQVANRLHPLRPAQTFLRLLSVSDVARRDEDAINAARIVAQRRQDGLPDATAAGQVDPVAREGRLAAGDDALELGDKGVRIRLGRHPQQVDAAHLGGGKAGDPLIGWVHLGHVEDTVGKDVDH